MVPYNLFFVGLVIGGMCLNPCCSGRWSRTRQISSRQIVHGHVLILVVVDDGPVLFFITFASGLVGVLILVVVDDGPVLDLIRLY